MPKGTHMDETAPQADAGRRGWAKMGLALLLLVVTTPLQVILLGLAPAALPDDPILGAALGRIAAGLLGALAFFFLGGRSWLRVTGRGLAYTLRRGWPLLLVGMVPAGWSFYQAATGGGFPAGFLPALP